MSEASVWDNIRDAYMQGASAMPGLALLVLGILTAASLVWLVLYRPAPRIGAIMPGPGPGDMDFSAGTPFWRGRRLPERLKLAAAPIGGALLRIGLAIALTNLLFGTYSGLFGYEIRDAAEANDAASGPFLILMAIGCLGLILPLIVIAVLRRFWLMGRRARLTVIDTRGDIGFHPWWIAELGLKAGDNVTLRAGRGIGKSGIVGIRSDIDRGRIAIPPAIRVALDLDIGAREVTILSREPFPVWGFVPAGLALLLGLTGLNLMSSSHTQMQAEPDMPSGPMLALCLSSEELQDVAKICERLQEMPLDPLDKELVKLQLARSKVWLDDPEGARREIDALLQGNPRLWRAYVERAKLAEMDRDYDRALQDVDAALDIAPHYEAFMLKGHLLNYSGRAPYGVEAFAKALDLSTPEQRKEVLFAEAATSFLVGDFEKVIARTRRAMDYGLDIAQAKSWSARAHLLAGRPKEAVSQLEQVVAADPYDPYAAIWLYIAELHAGADGVERLRMAAQDAGFDEWQTVLISALTGDTALESVTPGAYGNAGDEPQLREIQDRAQGCELYYFLGEKLLAKGDKPAAIARFKAAIETGITEYTEYRAALHRLRQLGVTS